MKAEDQLLTFAFCFFAGSLIGVIWFAIFNIIALLVQLT